MARILIEAIKKNPAGFKKAIKESTGVYDY